MRSWCAEHNFSFTPKDHTVQYVYTKKIFDISLVSGSWELLVNLYLRKTKRQSHFSGLRQPELLLFTVALWSILSLRREKFPFDSLVLLKTFELL